MPNDIIGWEKTTQYNIGLDLSFFNGRVVFNADAYLKKTNDLLFDFPVPNYTGFSSVPRNYGSVENKGLEFLLETVNLTGKFKWKTSFNISMNRNKITEPAPTAMAEMLPLIKKIRNRANNPPKSTGVIISGIDRFRLNTSEINTMMISSAREEVRIVSFLI